MRRIAYLIVAIILLTISTNKTESFVRSTVNSSNSAGIAWNLDSSFTTIVSGGRITYRINGAGSEDVPFADLEQAIDGAFKAWEDIPSSRVAFTKGPTTTVNTTGSDGVFPIFWLENSTTTVDGQNVAGALAVAFTFRLTSGPRIGEITDANIVFNGVENRWATNGDPTAFDIAEVATHEIGHTLGLDHSPIAAATMFPRTGLGVTKSRSLSSDDQIAASVIYPTPDFAATTGTIKGQVRDTNSANIFGAHVVAMDGNGNVVASALSQPDGSYSIRGLSPGVYTVYAEPLDAPGGIFSRNNLGSFYSNVNIDFLTTADETVTVNLGAETTLDFTVTRGTPALNINLIKRSTSNSFTNSGTTVNQGQSNVTIGVLGPGLPSSGAPLSVSGSGVTVVSTQFSTSGSDIVIRSVINVAADAPPGARNIIITNGSQRTIATGALEILGTAPDTTAPIVNITSPSNGTIVSGTIQLTAAATDNVSVAGVQFFVDDAPFGSEDTAAPFSVSVNTTTLVRGPHKFSATARDAAGNTSSSEVNVIADQPPVLGAIADQTMNKNTTRDIPLAVSDLDNDPLTVTVSGTSFASVPKVNDVFTLRLAPTSSDGGTFTLTVRVTDGLLEAQQTLRVTVNNRRPTIASIANQTVTQGTTKDVPLAVADPDGDRLTVTVSGASFARIVTGGDSVLLRLEPGLTVSGDFNLTVTVSDGKLSASTTVRVTVTIAPKRGDIDGNGQINVQDLIALIQILSGTAQANAAADVDGDGQVNTADLIRLVQALLGIAPL